MGEVWFKESSSARICGPEAVIGQLSAGRQACNVPMGAGRGCRELSECDAPCRYGSGRAALHRLAGADRCRGQKRTDPVPQQLGDRLLRRNDDRGNRNGRCAENGLRFV